MGIVDLLNRRNLRMPLRTKTLPYQVRHLDEERSAVATKPGDDFCGERMEFVQVQVVVVTDIERCTRTWCPTGEKLGTRALAQRVVIDNCARERGLRELVGTTDGKDVDVECRASGIVSYQALLGQIELRAQFVGWLVSNATVYLQHVAAARIKRSVFSQEQGRRTDARVLSSVAKVQIEDSSPVGNLTIELHLLAVVRAKVA